ncbi:MAG: Lipid A export ATP-binding/permease protein MsbA [Clostridiales bacterium 38_11]|nr:MAG: Lipid A export ATP-binding/permease protein MsbA [Clostridiales bacterium 38_11]HBH11955.1 ABC transporter ATP-binding protein [Clostridiales bacterium]
MSDYEFQEQDYSKKIDMKIWKKIFKYLIRYKKLVIILIFFMINLALADAIFPQMTQRAIDDFIVPGNIEGLESFILKFCLLIIWQSINIFIFISTAGKIEMNLTYDIREEAFDKLQKLSFSYYDRTPTGWIMARMTSDTRRLGEIISWGIVDIVWGFSLMIIIAGFMIAYNLRLALLTLSVVPVLAILSIYFQKKILEAYRVVRKINSKITGSFSEGISGAITTKVLVGEEKHLNEFKEITSDMKRSSIRAVIFSALFLPIVLTLSSVAIGLVVWSGGNSVIQGVITYGTLVLFISYATQYFEPIREVARVIAEFQQAQAAAERVISLIDEEMDIYDTIEVQEKYGTILEPKKFNWEELKGDIDFKNVSFRYKNGEEVLKSFNLSVKQGQSIALVGETGSGKSTIVNLICRFYEPTEGLIEIDGVDYRKRSIAWLHENIGYVLQAPHLFSGTIEDNIRYGKLDATAAEIIEAARLVNAHEFIMKFPESYQTQVGEGGGKLSTGEKQLISFARAIISDPRIFVLDEATSSIDTQTERMIQDAIEKVLQGRTSFVIAHRLSTIVNSDRILVIEKGEVVEEGTHDELMELKGHYHNLYTNQYRENAFKAL